jgi:hypothetical protein
MLQNCPRSGIEETVTASLPSQTKQGQQNRISLSDDNDSDDEGTVADYN